MKLSFTEAESEFAHDTWGANCGPHSVAAALNLSLDQVRPHFAAFEQKFKERGYGFTNPTMMGNALAFARQPFALTKNLKTKELREGISRTTLKREMSPPNSSSRLLHHGLTSPVRRRHRRIARPRPTSNCSATTTTSTARCGCSGSRRSRSSTRRW